MQTQGFARGFWVCLGLVGGCGGRGEVDSETATTGTSTADTGGDDLPTGGEPDLGPPVGISANREVDLLFVVDNSGSMAPVQAKLSQAIAALVDVLEAGDVKADYRIGVTTTDSGNPRCPSAQYTPEGGKLVLSSCIDRVDQGEFTFNSEDFSPTCTDYCTKRDSDLQVLATATQFDAQKMPRKWIERTAGKLNIAGVADAAEALQCYLPQGVAGCGFESHLESMYLALASAQSSKSATNYGFLRDAAQLAIVIVSDETDCSYNPATKEIFTTNKVFWNDPDVDTAPTSAMCWRAGVACTGGPGVYSECHAEDHDKSGSAGTDPKQAVLQPIGKYIDFVKMIESFKQELDARQRVKVSLLTGVPVGYDSFAAELQYADLSPDDEYQLNFGIGPGCVAGDPGFPEAAVPPVREREFAEAFAESDAGLRPLYSLCAGDYGAALAAMGKEIADGVMPSCMPNCVRDTDPQTPALDAKCEVIETDIHGEDTPLQPCQEVNGAWQPPGMARVCFALRGDPSGDTTPSPLDDMSAYCVEEGYNLEFDIVRLEPAEFGASLTVKCEQSANRKVDCPNL